MHVAEILARFVADTPVAALPAETMEAAKRGMLDTLGVMLAGTREPAARSIVAVLERLGGRPTSRVAGWPLRTNAAQAALANGVMAHALDFDDDIGAGYGHPSAVLVPAVLALGEMLRRSGRDLLAAYVLGTEVWYKVASALPRLHPLGWHPTGVFGTLGAAAAAAHLLRLDADRTTMALGLAASQSCGMIQNLGTMAKPFHAGNAARAGTLAALMAAEGCTASHAALDGPLGFAFALSRGLECDVATMTHSLGLPYAILRPGLNVKRYPCYYSAHKCIDAALDIVRSHDLVAGDIEAVHCRVPARVAKILFHAAPVNGLEAKFSMQFFMAASIVERRLGLTQFTDEAPARADIRALMARVSTSVHKSADGADPPHDHPDTVEIRLRDGRMLLRTVALARGHADNPLSPQDLHAKYHQCATRVMAPVVAERLAGIVGDLERVDDLAPMMHILHTLRAP